MSSAMWKSELASVCRRHRDLVAIYEAPEGTLALLLRQTLVPLSEERGRWFNDTRRTARAVVASLRAAGVTEDVTVLQWRPLPDVAQVLTGWPCCYLSDPRRCAQLADIVGRSEEHTSELQSHVNLVCRLLLEKKKKKLYDDKRDKKKKKKNKIK